MRNTNVINALPDAAKVKYVPAQLETSAGTISLLYNPESLSYSRKAVYAEAVTGGTAISDQNYVRSTGKTLELPNLLLDSHDAKKSLRQLLDGIEALLLPREGSAPDTVSFVWGSERYGPAVLTSMDYEVTGLLGGEPSVARLDLSLLRVPEATTAITPAPTGETSLTDRQREDGRVKASEWLGDNASRLRSDVRSAFNAKRFNYLTDELGNISIADELGDVLGKVGTWDGFDFNALEELL